MELHLISVNVHSHPRLKHLMLLDYHITTVIDYVPYVCTLHQGPLVALRL